MGKSSRTISKTWSVCSMSKIPPTIEKEILSAFSGGLVPSRGTGFVQMGRDSELGSVMANLASTGDRDSGLGVFRFVVGQYGSGKSFMLQFIREVALGKDFVVLNADIARDCRFTGSGKEGLKLYRELIKNMSTRTQATGGALEIVLNKWISKIRSNLAKSKGIEEANVSVSMILQEMRRMTSDMAYMPMYSDFIRMVSRYWIASESQSLENDALRWLKGDYEQRSMARNDLDIGVIIDDSNWYQFIRIWTRFVVSIGYRGLVIILDEGVFLAKLSKKACDNNYDSILAIYNDIYSGSTRNLSVFMSETPASLDDNKRGLYSYDPLRTRLEPGRFINGFSNPNGPVMTLRFLNREEIVALLTNLSEIHAHVNKYECTVSEDDIRSFVDRAFAQSVSGEILPRMVCREFLGVLEIMRHEGMTFSEIVRGFRFGSDGDRFREDINADLDV